MALVLRCGGVAVNGYGMVASAIDCFGGIGRLVAVAPRTRCGGIAWWWRGVLVVVVASDGVSFAV